MSLQREERGEGESNVLIAAVAAAMHTPSFQTQPSFSQSQQNPLLLLLLFLFKVELLMQEEEGAKLP
jgi:hypothetical protein